MDRIYIFDTTLRDGEQCPGASLNFSEKLKISKILESLNVDVLEAGFPVSSEGDFKAVNEISKNIKNVTVAGLARAKEKDIDICYEALSPAKNKRIHVFIATSDIHLKYKLKMSREEVLERAIFAVKYAKKYNVEVEFSAEDASRTDIDFLCDIVKNVIDAGADVVNIPDTVGYSLPEEFGKLIKTLYDRVYNISKTILSVHCHNDLGLGTSNTLSGIMNGARQIECTINGLGERAGNTAMEEIVMILKTRQNLNFDTLVNTKEIYNASKVVSNLTGISVQRNKAIVGQNAFSHESGIHQHGVLSNPLTYEIMTPESIGLFNNENNIVLGKHSGRHAFANKIESMGYNFTKEKIDELFLKFKILSDKKKNIFDEDIELLINESLEDKKNEIIKILYFSVISGSNVIPTATVKILDTKNGQEHILKEAVCGDGPVDAMYKAIDKMLNLDMKLEEYNLRSVSKEKDAIGDVNIKISKVFDNERVVFAFGKGKSTDVLEASLKAYVDAINNLFIKINM